METDTAAKSTLFLSRFECDRWRPDFPQFDGSKSRTVAQHALPLSAGTWLTSKGFHNITTCAPA